MTQRLSFSIDVPPSVNNLFATVGKLRRKTPTYLRWIEGAGYFINVQMRRPENVAAGGVPGTMPVRVRLGVPSNISKAFRDLDNMIKPVLDVLVTMRILAGDDMRYVRSVGADVTEPLPPGSEKMITVTIEWELPE